MRCTYYDEFTYKKVQNHYSDSRHCALHRDGCSVFGILVNLKGYIPTCRSCASHAKSFVRKV